MRRRRRRRRRRKRIGGAGAASFYELARRWRQEEAIEIRKASRAKKQRG